MGHNVIHHSEKYPIVTSILYTFVHRASTLSTTPNEFIDWPDTYRITGVGCKRETRRDRF
jgi:hypothetical protein